MRSRATRALLTVLSGLGTAAGSAVFAVPPGARAAGYVGETLQ